MNYLDIDKYNWKKDKGILIATDKKVKVTKIKKQKKIKPKKIRNRDKPRSYKTYIVSDLWTQRKNRYWRNHLRKCMACDSFDTIQLHHGKYDDNTFGKEVNAVLFPLCKLCHAEYHEKNGVQHNMIEKTKAFIAQKQKECRQDISILENLLNS